MICSRNEGLFNSLSEVPEYVRDVADGVATVPMRDLRIAAGHGRLGKHNVVEISRHLRRQGIHHLPADLPTDQNAPVRLYVPGSRVATLLHALHAATEDADELLRRAAGAMARVSHSRYVAA